MIMIMIVRVLVSRIKYGVILITTLMVCHTTTFTIISIVTIIT